MNRLSLLISTGLALGAALMARADEPRKKITDDERTLAILKARGIELAVKGYIIKYSKPPRRIGDLLTPPDGKPLMEGGKKAIEDPWGKEFRLEIMEEKGGFGGLQITVWTTAPDGTRIDNSRRAFLELLKKKEATPAEKDAARIAVRNLEKAVKTYYIKYGDFPGKLGDLIKPPDNGTPFVEGGARALIDPWGTEYQLKIENGKSEPVIRIWTVAPDGTRIENSPKEK